MHTESISKLTQVVAYLDKVNSVSMRTSNALGHTENPHILQDRSNSLVVSWPPPTDRHDTVHRSLCYLSFANIFLN